MDWGQYESLREAQCDLRPVHILDHLSDLSDRTLLYGYTCDRETFHVYLRDGRLFTVYSMRDTIEASELPREMTFAEARGLVPDKRVYPSASDFQFCSVLQRLGIDIPFTTFDDRPAAQFYGKTIDALELAEQP